ncbi:MAG TPA: hypothetical protein VL856_12535 [Acidimicrobiia bacterium]|jgi:hypothetical protein|nr:hypothetical protein [Acidimicrobiia bacterium]
MNVSTLGLGAGSVSVLPVPQSGGEEPAARGPELGGTERVAWFDLNGDGHIDNRGPLEGGDGTMIVPSAVHVPTYTRQVVHQEAPAESHPVVALATPAATNDVQTQRVIASYQRYGQQPTNNTATNRDVA